jgi:P4 family phage/plasmid primase-like protien
MLTILASYLKGSTQEQTFQIWTGQGSNGKSVVTEFFEKTLGDDYCGKFPITLLTKPRAGSNACTPELHEVMTKRFASMQEPDDNDMIYTGSMKEYTGGDKLYSRGLYSKPQPFKPMFKLILCCNKMPQIKGYDYGTWRRIRVLPFCSKFVDKPEGMYEFKKDKMLTSKFDDWREAFMFILIQYLKEYKQNGIREPNEVLKASLDYKKRSDVILQYLSETIVQTNNPNDKLRGTDFYDGFKMWYKSSQHGTCPNKQDFLDYIKNNTSYVKNGNLGFKGIKYMNQMSAGEDEIEQ